jgi:hypothetical protein
MKLQFNKNTQGNSKPINKTSEDKNKIYIFAGVIVVLLCAMIGIYIKLGYIKLPGAEKKNTTPITPVNSGVNTRLNTSLNTQTPTSGNNTQDSEMAPTNFIDPFSGPYNLTGVIVNDTGRNVAIIEGNGRNFVVAENDTIDNSWRVESITMKQVILSWNNKRYALTMPDNIK